MNRFFFGLLAIAMMAIMISSCKKDKDKTAPKIEFVKVNGAASDKVTVNVPNTGTTISLEMRFTDDKDLKEYKIDIHDAFDGHGHGKHSPTTPFTFSEVVSISGKDVTATKTISIPGNASAGPYHLMVFLLDKEGNEAEFVEIELILTRSDAPVITVANPSFSPELEVEIGDTIELKGTITDDKDLKEVHIVLAKDDHGHGKIGDDDEIYDEEFELPGANDTTWDFNEISIQGKLIVIPANAKKGDYKLSIMAKDSDGNHTLWSGIVHVD